MKKMRFFIDTHDKKNETFPEKITAKDLEEFYKSYQEACSEESVISMKIAVGFEEGRAFCLNIAPDKEAVERVHQKVGLPFDEITEVTTISSSDILLNS